MTKIRRGVACVVAFGTALTWLVACSPAGDQATASLGGASSATPLAPAGRPFGAAVPDGFPVMEGAEPVTPLPAEPGLVARWITGAVGPDVYEYYTVALPAAGFRVENRFPGGAAAVIRFRVPDGRLLDVALTLSGDGTRIDLRRAEPEP